MRRIVRDGDVGRRRGDANSSDDDRDILGRNFGERREDCGRVDGRQRLPEVIQCVGSSTKLAGEISPGGGHGSGLVQSVVGDDLGAGRAKRREILEMINWRFDEDSNLVGDNMEMSAAT